MKQFKPLKELRKIIEKCEKDWQKNIDDEKNPILKNIKKDYKRLSEIEADLNYFYLAYGIEIKSIIPRNITNTKAEQELQKWCINCKSYKHQPCEYEYHSLKSRKNKKDCEFFKLK